MKKVNIANFVIFDLANRFSDTANLNLDNDIVDLVAENWHKKHFVSVSRGIEQHHNSNINQKFLM